MRFISRFFMIIALVFLALDLRDAMQGGDAPAVTPAPTASEAPSNEAATGTETTRPLGETTVPQVPPAADDAATTTPATPPPAPATDDVSEPNEVVLYSLGQRWSEIHRESLLQAEPAITRHVAPWLWGSIVQPLLLQPGFLIFFFLSLLFAFFSWLIGRSRRDDW